MLIAIVQFNFVDPLASDDLGIDDQMIARCYVGLNQRFILMQPSPTFFVIETVAHWLTVWTNHRQVHLGNDVGQNPFYSNCIGHNCFDALGARLIQKRYLCACLLYTSPSPRDATLSRMPSSA